MEQRSRPAARNARNGSQEFRGGRGERTAIGYVRVSTDIQAHEGLSLEAQQAAISQDCALHELKPARVYQDVLSGASGA